MTEQQRPPTVLVVDDEELVRNVSRMMLERLGYGVQVVAGGVEALGALRQGGVDVVLLDLTMPGMSGLETLDALRAIDPAVPVILTSGFGEQDAGAGRAGDGRTGFLQKPFQIPALKEAVAAALRR